jgi:RecA-family ATPase
MTPAEGIVRHFKGDWHGSSGAIPTPGHSPKDRGTTVKMGDNGDVVFYSHNDPQFDFRSLKDECRRLGLLPEWQPQRQEWRVVGTYEFRDEAGALLYRTRRHEHPTEGKRFTVERPDGTGWKAGIGDTRRVLYRLPELMAADIGAPVYLVEGERKADKICAWGRLGIAIAFGCKGWRKEYAEPLRCRTVIILPDNDDEGRAFAKRAATDIAAADGKAFTLEPPGLPAKGDIVDWSGGVEDLDALTSELITVPAETFALADLAAWDVMTPKPKRFFMDRFIPAHEVTLVTGAGGSNKSTFGQQLATAAAAGLPMLGVPVETGASLYTTAEDGGDRLHWSQAHYCKALNVRMADLAGKLHLASLRGRLGNELATFDADGRLRVAPAYQLLRNTIAATKAKVVVLDNVAHLFTGNENDRGQVTAFINLLYSLCLEFETTILLIAHPNKAGDSYSGSTAWLNAVRSQITITRPEDSIDPDERILSLGKANYARLGETLAFRWHDFALVTDADIPTDQRTRMAATLQATADNEVFMQCLRERNRQERPVSESPASRTFAGLVFAQMPESKGIGRARLEAAMDRLFRVGAIERGFVGRINRKDKFGLRESAPTPRADPAPTGCADVRSVETQTCADTHPLPKGMNGAAHWPAAPSPEDITWDDMETSQ